MKISKVITTLSATIQPILQRMDLPVREHRQSVWNLRSRWLPDIRHWWLLIPMVTMSPEISILTSLSTVGGRLPYMDKPHEETAGYKHQSTDKFMNTFKKTVMDRCQQEGLHQIDLLAPAERKRTEHQCNTLPMEAYERPENLQKKYG